MQSKKHLFHAHLSERILKRDWAKWIIYLRIMQVVVSENSSIFGIRDLGELSVKIQACLAKQAQSLQSKQGGNNQIDKEKA